MKKIVLVLAVLAVTGSAWAQSGIVPEGYTGLWRFQDSANKLTATVGADLINSTPDNANWMTGPYTRIGVPGAPDLFSDGGIVQDRSWDYMTCYHGISANGGGDYVNQYTIAVDVYPGSGWNSLYQTSWSGNSNDGDLWIDASDTAAATIGVGDVGYSTSTFDATKWHRIVWSVDNGDDTGAGGFFRAYVDGALFLDGAGQGRDGRFALEVDWFNGTDIEPGRFHFFADNDWEDAWILCGTAATWGRALSTDEIYNMGGWIGGASEPTPLTIVPEPGTISLLAIGGLLILAAALKRKFRA
jgi:hypothetical protein